MRDLTKKYRVKLEKVMLEEKIQERFSWGLLILGIFLAVYLFIFQFAAFVGIAAFAFIVWATVKYVKGQL